MVDCTSIITADFYAGKAVVAAHIIILVQLPVMEKIVYPETTAFCKDRAKEGVSRGNLRIDRTDHLIFALPQVFQFAFPVGKPGDKHAVSDPEIVAPDAAFPTDHFGFNAAFFPEVIAESLEMSVAGIGGKYVECAFRYGFVAELRDEKPLDGAVGDMFVRDGLHAVCEERKIRWGFDRMSESAGYFPEKGHHLR